MQDIRKYKEYKLSLRDVLIKPVQRLSKYKLLLENLLKYTKVIGDKDDICSIMKAIEVVEKINRSTNDCMDLESIQGFDVSFRFEIL